MFGGGREVIAVGGRIRVCCPRCKKTRYYNVPQNIRKKNVRCHCGKTTAYTMNRRGKIREICTVQARLSVGSDKAQLMQVNLCNISETGVGFLLKNQSNRKLLSVGKKSELQYRLSTGKPSIRKIEITSVGSCRIGARFIDRLI